MMMFMLIVLLVFVIYFIIFYKRQGTVSRPIFILLLFSIITSISLAENYISSLIPQINDGIGVSNDLAKWIITDDVRWTHELFKQYYISSVNISLLLLVIYSVVVLFEKNWK